MAKRKNTEEIRLKKRDLWIKRTIKWSGLDQTEVESLLMTPRTQSVRVNPLAAGDFPTDLLAKPISWCGNGYASIVRERYDIP